MANLWNNLLLFTVASKYLSVCAHGKLYWECPEWGGKMAACLHHLGGLLVVADTQRATFQWTGGGCSDISRAQCPYCTRHTLTTPTYGGVKGTHARTHKHFILVLKTFHIRILICLSFILRFFFLCLSYCLFFKVNASFLQSIRYNSTTQSASGFIHLAASCAHTVLVL